MTARLGPAAPAPGSAESEALRRFRSYAAASLRRGSTDAPAIDGLRVNERRVTALLGAWSEAASEVAGERRELIRNALDPLIKRFQSSLRTTATGRRLRGAPRSRRRAVIAAIDRVADAFLAIDADSGTLVDANPAAAALLGVARDALLGVDAMSFVASDARDELWIELDAMTEGAETRRFSASFRDVEGSTIPVECSVTRFAQRTRTLALIVARPV